MSSSRRAGLLGHALGQRQQLVGRVAHGGDHDHDVLARRLASPPRGRPPGRCARRPRPTSRRTSERRWAIRNLSGHGGAKAAAARMISSPPWPSPRPAGFRTWQSLQAVADQLAAGLGRAAVVPFRPAARPRLDRHSHLAHRAGRRHQAGRPRSRWRRRPGPSSSSGRPLMDRYPLPFLGRKRGWIVVTQVVLLVLGLALAAVSDRPEAVGARSARSRWRSPSRPRPRTSRSTRTRWRCCGARSRVPRSARASRSIARRCGSRAGSP